MKFGPKHNNDGVRPEITGIRFIVEQAFFEAGISGEFVATSGKRVKKLGQKLSKHHDGLAEDYDSTKPVSTAFGGIWQNKLAHKLGRQYDVIWHDSGSGWHLHVEFDPKV